MKLLYRGIKDKNESLMDYLARLARKNGYSSAKVFENRITDAFYQVCRGDKYNLSNYGVQRLALEYVLKRDIQLDCSDRMKAGTRGLWIASPRICEQCLDELGFIPFYWRLRDYQYCHIHGRYLVGEKSGIQLPATCYATAAVKAHINRNDSQKKIYDELDTVYYEQQLLLDLACGFSSDESVRISIVKAINNSVCGKYVGYDAQDRIYKIASDVACDGDDVEMLVSLICLAVANLRNDGLFCAIKSGPGFKKLQAYALFRIGTDCQLRLILDGLSRRTEKNDFQAENLQGLLGRYYYNSHLREMVRITVYYIRVFEYWTDFDDVMENLIYDMDHSYIKSVNLRCKQHL